MGAIDKHDVKHANAMAKRDTTYPMIESGVVRFREGHNELAGALVARVYFNTGFLQSPRVHESHELEKEIRLSFEQVRGFFAYRGFEFIRILPRHAVPCLRLAPMH